MSSAASGARAQARRLEAVLGALCLLPVLLLLARLGAPAARLGASAAQVRAGGDGQRGGRPGGPRACVSAGGQGEEEAGIRPPAPPTLTWPVLSNLFLPGCKSSKLG